jgi:DNA mismatch repair protein MutL
MGIIFKLDQQTTNLIAAGEVIERAASVVKELVENSIDAGANNVKIKLVDSGLTEINVSDNGSGMDAVDAKMAIESHATSKIKDGNDLFRIQTLGFRGEALPSIVSVSNFNLKTSRDGVKGVMYSLRGGNFISEALISHSRGTEITVKNLFFNTPARLQNVQSQSVELSYVTDYVTKMALSKPNISFTLINNDREILKTYGNNELLEVIMASYGAEVAREMIDIFNDDGYFQIKGYASKLGISRSTRNHINMIVNGRIVKNNNLINAVVKGYNELMVTGRYPIVVLNITVDPGMIDVNVHPAKLEVRFSNEESLLKLISTTIEKSLKNANLIVNLDKQEIDIEDTKDEIDNIFNLEDDLFVQEVSKSLESIEKTDGFEEDLTESVEINKNDIVQETIQEEVPAEKYDQQKYTFYENEFKYKGEEKKERLPKMSYIGQLHGTYILAQAEDEFYIIDQHAAAERVNYERILEELKKDDNIKYELLIPFKLDFTSAEAILINENLPSIKALGISLEDFGGGSFTIREVPIWIKRGKEQEYVEEIITQIINNKKKEKYEFLTNLAKSIACKKSIKGNEYHNTLEIEYLLEDLGNANNPYTCPHGRPVIVKFSKYEIEKWFKRVV